MLQCGKYPQRTSPDNSTPTKKSRARAAGRRAKLVAKLVAKLSPNYRQISRLLSPADVVHVKYWGVGVEAGGVELVAVLHGDLAEGSEVLLEVGLLDLRQPRLHHLSGRGRGGQTSQRTNEGEE